MKFAEKKPDDPSRRDFLKVLGGAAVGVSIEGVYERRA